MRMLPRNGKRQGMTEFFGFPFFTETFCQDPGPLARGMEDWFHFALFFANRLGREDCCLTKRRNDERSFLDVNVQHALFHRMRMVPGKNVRHFWKNVQ